MITPIPNQPVKFLELGEIAHNELDPTCNCRGKYYCQLAEFEDKLLFQVESTPIDEQELVQNSDLSDPTGWTFVNGCVYDAVNDEADYTGAIGDLQQSPTPFTLFANRWYRFKVVIENTIGNDGIDVLLSTSVSDVGTISGDGTHIIYYMPPLDTTFVRARRVAVGTSTFSITEYSVVEMTRMQLDILDNDKISVFNDSTDDNTTYGISSPTITYCFDWATLVSFARGCYTARIQPREAEFPGFQGFNYLQNGDFSNTDFWTLLDPGWTIVGGVLDGVNTLDPAANQGFMMIPGGRFYKLTFTILNYVGGFINFDLVASKDFSNTPDIFIVTTDDFDEDGDYEVVIDTTAFPTRYFNRLRIETDGNFTGQIDNIAINPVCLDNDYSFEHVPIADFASDPTFQTQWTLGSSFTWTGAATHTIFHIGTPGAPATATLIQPLLPGKQYLLQVEVSTLAIGVGTSLAILLQDNGIQIGVLDNTSPVNTNIEIPIDMTGLVEETILNFSPSGTGRAILGYAHIIEVDEYECEDGIYDSECFQVAETQICTNKLSWTNSDNAFGFNFVDALLTFFLRVRSKLRNADYKRTEKEVFFDSEGNGNITYSRVYKQKELIVGEVPEYVHDAIDKGLESDTFNIDDKKFVFEENRYTPTHRISSKLSPSTIKLTESPQLLENDNC